MQLTLAMSGIFTALRASETQKTCVRVPACSRWGNMEVASAEDSSCSARSRSKAAASMRICSSNSDFSTTAEAPAASMALMVSTRVDSGEEPTMMGFLSEIPM